ncbi:CAMK/CAMKL/SNRK protein kinase [Salpingoeca rosetta]|uniref:CAMK/CAMKL/SNRK protein kinase n=1 Tax=Salpingoeca rosetta (strain ATCC 50818 / BSB-021) TaxID=946362 RepID=F2U1R8_SALR5|nr:CAMK/CAMKL/SNRK protein kinase [Salpingoeca rosetta]EGD81570.1 CAMK/CAMKL/SNRK protein kinase [Salpingoeca rosetta]|eukprot:XP_004996774.1 CAMK/CAMKL/SNRK protein kinase [Salpingoeca rosetta]
MLGQNNGGGTAPATPQGFVGMYDFLGNLGKGHFAVVKLAQHVLSKQRVAVKVIEKGKLKPDEEAHMQHEIQVMKLLRHPHVIRLYQVCNTNSRIYLILELGDGGDLYERIKKSGAFPEEKARRFFRQIAEAVSYCHKNHVAHRDLKPENVVFRTNKHGDEVAKVTDFGLSNSFSPGEKLKTACGSVSYSSPEILLGEPYDGPLADMWSLGVILYMMLTGELPFQGHDDYTTVMKIMDTSYKQPEGVSEQGLDLLSKLLSKECEDRISMDSVLKHQWLAGNKDRAAATASTAETEPGTGRPKLTPDEHERIMRIMEEAGIARDAIASSISANSYDYIASTYFLLADKEVRRRARGQAKKKSMDQAARDSAKKDETVRLRRAMTLRASPTHRRKNQGKPPRLGTKAVPRRPRARPEPLPDYLRDPEPCSSGDEDGATTPKSACLVTRRVHTTSERSVPRTYLDLDSASNSSSSVSPKRGSHETVSATHAGAPSFDFSTPQRPTTASPGLRRAVPRVEACPPSSGDEDDADSRRTSAGFRYRDNDADDDMDDDEDGMSTPDRRGVPPHMQHQQTGSLKHPRKRDSRRVSSTFHDSYGLSPRYSASCRFNLPMYMDGSDSPLHKSVSSSTLNTSSQRTSIASVESGDTSRKSSYGLDDMDMMRTKSTTPKFFLCEEDEDEAEDLELRDGRVYTGGDARRTALSPQLGRHHNSSTPSRGTRRPHPLQRLESREELLPRHNSESGLLQMRTKSMRSIAEDSTLNFDEEDEEDLDEADEMAAMEVEADAGYGVRGTDDEDDGDGDDEGGFGFGDDDINDTDVQRLRASTLPILDLGPEHEPHSNTSSPLHTVSGVSRGATTVDADGSFTSPATATATGVHKHIDGGQHHHNHHQQWPHMQQPATGTLSPIPRRDGLERGSLSLRVLKRESASSSCATIRAASGMNSPDVGGTSEDERDEPVMMRGASDSSIDDYDNVRRKFSGMEVGGETMADQDDDQNQWRGDVHDDTSAPTAANSSGKPDDAAANDHHCQDRDQGNNSSDDGDGDDDEEDGAEDEGRLGELSVPYGRHAFFGMRAASVACDMNTSRYAGKECNVIMEEEEEEEEEEDEGEGEAESRDILCESLPAAAHRRLAQAYARADTQALTPPAVGHGTATTPALPGHPPPPAPSSKQQLHSHHHHHHHPHHVGSESGHHSSEDDSAASPRTSRSQLQIAVNN